VTRLAHDAALLGISVDTGRLYDGADPGYELWISSLVDIVNETLAREDRKQKAKMTK
jgi:hypothetical protein